MKLLQVKKCFFCVPLETGAKLFGFAHLIVSGLMFGLILEHQIGRISSIGDSGSLDKISSMTQFVDIGITLQVIVGVYLLVGLYEKRPALMLTWVLYEATSVITGLEILILTLIGGNISLRSTFIIEHVAEEVLFIVVYTYFCIVIYSLYQNISRNHNENRRQVGLRNY